MLLNNVEMLLHLEFQSSDDTNMALRLLEYNVLAVSEYRQPVLSCVLYLRKGQTMIESPLQWTLPNGQRVLTFTFLIVKLWEIPAEEITRTGLVGLLPLLPLTRDGKQHEVEATDPAQFQELPIKIGLAKDIEEARRALMGISNP